MTKKEQSEKLRACPFCGCKRHHVNARETGCNIECKRCWASVSENNKEKAFALWNGYFLNEKKPYKIQSIENGE